MINVSFYHKQTGILNGTHLSVMDRETVLRNTPADHEAIEGHHDPLTKRVDVTNTTLVDYIPPPPSADHEWHARSRRWLLSAAAGASRAKRMSALSAISALEAKSLRSMREHILASLAPHAGLQAIEDEIAQLRKAL